jgi:hypothetical protein
MKITHVALVGSIGLLTLGALTPLQAAVIVPAYVNSTGTFSGTTSNDGSETTGQTANAGTMVVYSLGSAPVTFGDISITSSNVNTNHTANNFNIQVQAVDDPNATTGWTTIATASNIFGYTNPSGTASSAGNTWDAGRRLEFAPVTKQYFRYVNTDTTTDVYPEIQVNRPVVITSSTGGPTSTTRIMNSAADSNPATTFRSAGTSGSFIFDALVPTGEGVQTITLQHGPAYNVTTNPFSFPTGTVTVLDSNDPTFATFNSTNFTLSSNDTTAGAIYTLTYANPVNSRYFEFEWNNVVTSAASATEFAEVGITTSPVSVPEPASMSLLAAGASLLLLRRRRRSHESQKV